MNTSDFKSLLDMEAPLLFDTNEAKNHWWRKVKNTPTYQPFLDEIQMEGKRLLQEKEPELSYSLFKLFEENGSRVEYEKVYFEKRRRLTTFAIMVLLEPDNIVYREELENCIWSICNEYSWCLPAHLLHSNETSTNIHYSLHTPMIQQYSIDLFAAETAFSLAEILKLTEDSLSPLICKRIYEEIYKRIFSSFIRTTFKWETETHNWAAVCAGSIGAAAFHLIDDQEELAIILEKVLPAMDCYLSGFNKDGFCLEGYGYWQYGFGYYVYFADLLKKRTLGKLDLFASEKIHQIAFFQQRCFLEDHLVVNFSDAVPTASVYLGLSHYLSQIYGDVEVPRQELRAKYTDDHCSRWAPAIRNLLWFDENAEEKAWGSGTFYSKDSGWMISRYHEPTGSFSFAAKGGHNDEPHNHNDLGHFILQGNQEVFLKDLGSGLYNKDYFGEKRYTFVGNGSQGHSVPIINHQYQVEGESHFARILQADAGEEVDFFELDLVKAYEVDTLSSLIRKFSWVKKNLPKLVLEDTYTFTEQPVLIIERLIVPSLLITEEEDGVVLEGKSRVRILYDKRQLYLDVKKFEFINHSGVTEEHLALDFTVLHPVKNCKVELVFQFE
ncbi:hypothetical protein [Robertmurraya sp. P23]|uniref:hypothetical protein n=1 Tax=Robertmurraya sp. P23 TaxID=3436931 RepID=UPI003D976601